MIYIIITKILYMDVQKFFQLYKNNTKIVMTTCYDFLFAKIISKTNIDAVLVGDSVAMVYHGYPSTIYATMDMMIMHTKAVANGIKKKIIIADLPFLSYRKNLILTMNAVESLIKAGANAIKLEGINGNEKIIRYIVNSGIPVMGHLGLTPQFINQFGGYKIQGRDKKASYKLITESKIAEDIGCFSIVLECIPSKLANIITKKISIPTIGIGAGKNTSGQILVLSDILGMTPEFNTKFIKSYLNGYDKIQKVIENYVLEVKKMVFPSKENSY